MNKRNVLVTGGAGYIGSHIVKELISDGYNVIVVDNLIKGHKESIGGAFFIKGDFGNEELLKKLFEKHNIDAVIHMAAFSEVGESVKDPNKYFENNFKKIKILIRAMIKNGVRFIVFSSTAAVYGEPEEIPITEDSKKSPTNPYGETKLKFEEELVKVDNEENIKFVSLRYFNAAGADPSGEIGEDHNPESHLIPLVLEVALLRREKIMIFGDDYDTMDGTCVRDYIHVTDLAKAHILALEALYDGKDSVIYNIGNGQGFTVKEVVNMARKVTGHPIPTEVVNRRLGDPAVLIACSDKINKELSWNPKFADLETIINTAWNWHKSHPDGY